MRTPSIACFFVLVVAKLGAADAAKNLRASHRDLKDSIGWPMDPMLAQDQLEQQVGETSPGKLITHTSFVQNAGRGIEPIQGCFIVNMEAGPTILSANGTQTIGFDTSTADALIEELTKASDTPGIQSASASVSYQYASATNGFAACLSPASLQTVLDSHDVAFVEQDFIVKADVTQRNVIWGLDRIDQTTGTDGIYDTGNLDGAGIDVYVIDTGVNTQHSDYKARLKGGKDFVGDGKGYEDCNGHGTHCAGTVLGSTYGVAKKANLYGVRVLGCSGSGSNSGILAGVNWAVDNAAQTGRPSVLSMSLGGGKSSSSNAAVAGAKRAGLTVVVAAGNENTNACTKSPASEQSVITVGSSTKKDVRSSFSNYGTCVDLFAPGSDIKSAWIGGSGATNTISGTSMATPHVAGAAALELELMKMEGSGSNPDDVWRRMKARATPNKISDVKGSPNLLLRIPKDDTPLAPTAPPTPLTGCGTKSGVIIGQKCVFPFTFKSTKYTACTTDGDPDGQLWCSTATDSSGKHLSGNWGICNNACSKPGGGDAPTPSPPTPPSNDCNTIDNDVNKTCAFPFTFNGVTYHTCTTAADPGNRAWCSTLTDANGNHVTGAGKWGHCSSSCTDE